MKTFIPYVSETVKLFSGDILILFTDGITEAMNKQGEEFSDKALETLALSISDKSSQEVVNTIQQEVQKFAEGTTQSDDMTLVVIKVK